MSEVGLSVKKKFFQLKATLRTLFSQCKSNNLRAFMEFYGHWHSLNYSKAQPWFGHFSSKTVKGSV